MKAILLAAISAIGLGAGAQAATIDVGPGTVSCFLSGTATGADCQGIVSGPPTIYSSTSATIYGIGANSDVIVQAGTNLSTVDLFPTLEHVLEKPMIPINVATVWHALRACGIDDRITGKGRLLEEF